MAATPRHALITGSSGLIGSQAVVTLDRLGWRVLGIDSNMRFIFFGEDGDTRSNLDWLRSTTKGFVHSALDIRERDAVLNLFAEHRFDLIVHCAAQPSHDLAAKMPFEDWDTNAPGTLNRLEAARRHAAQSPFIHVSTNKVYGDRPNLIELRSFTKEYGLAGLRVC